MRGNGRVRLPKTTGRLGTGNAVDAVIETPQGSRNKFSFDEETGLFKLSRMLPAGASFPFSFGFIPGTLADDGDPLDVLVIADESLPTGCLVSVRLIGVLEADQVENGKKVRNDRLIAVAAKSMDHQDLKSFKHINDHLTKEIEHFFSSYNELEGRTFTVRDRRGPKRAVRCLRSHLRRPSGRTG